MRTTKKAILLVGSVAAAALASFVGYATANATPPSKGAIPPSAYSGGRIDASQAPDYIGVVDASGKLVGYAAKSDVLRHVSNGPGTADADVPVYASNLSTVVGYEVPGRGFVPGSTPPSTASSPSSNTTWTLPAPTGSGG
jgi:hypothetical protein